jgi:MoaA/NifB/PqqE/SkfB family radical SAM enzyme
VLAGRYETYCFRDSAGIGKRKRCTQCVAVLGGAQEWKQPLMERPPEAIWLEHDNACNLHCPACRQGTIYRRYDQDARDAEVEQLCREFLPTAQFLVAGLAGEPLMSESIMRIIGWHEACPQLRLTLFTNGLLLPLRWSQIPTHKVREFNLSIDASTEETYRQVRPPGRWERVLESLRLLQRHGARVVLRFVVQAANYRDMPGLVTLAKEYGCEGVIFTSLVRMWQTEEMYATMNVSDPQHALHADLQRVLQDPVLRDPIVTYSLKGADSV